MGHLSEAKKHYRVVSAASLQLLVIIVDREKVRDVEKSIQNTIRRIKRPHLVYMINGEGTASSKILDMLGIGAEEKSILICIEPIDCIRRLQEQICKSLHLEQPGNGIIFSLPLSNTCSIKRGENMEHKMAEHTHDLIVSIVNQGYSDALMDVAKKAGARGGTVVRARRLDMQDAVKLVGISVQLEKEITMIVVPHHAKREIVEAIKPFCGKEADAKGIMFSLAAEDVFGISFE